ncbi:hypothetical protein MHBO_000617 [Bonamia ostreae]|uniref:RRM domain-containing protein n=1 Tax=Bonamia ostreae TaxID=126728 RepID=A0ABV2AG77_9EUKA
MPREKELHVLKSRDRRSFAVRYEPKKAGYINGKSIGFHDKALRRAEKANYNADKDPMIKGNPFKTLFVSRLEKTLTENQIKAVFERFGDIKRIRLVKNKNNVSRGYAFLEFRRSKSFMRAYTTSNKMVIKGKRILVDFERERIMKGWKPRRLGFIVIKNWLHYYRII